MDVTPQRKTRAQEEAISRERPARRMQAPQGAFHVIHGEEPSQPLKPENELAPSVIRTCCVIRVLKFAEPRVFLQSLRSQCQGQSSRSS
eukprot:999778-Amphidinium_carterae.1